MNGLELSPRFPRLRAPGTGRLAIRLTEGPAFHYPLYYYLESLTPDGRFLVHHRAGAGEVQLRALELASGESRGLTSAKDHSSWWRPWCVDSGRGVLDHRSALDPARRRVLYFDGPELRAADWEAGEGGSDAPLFRLPAGREAIGQNCVMPGGDWFVYIHADAGLFASLFPPGWDYDEYHRRRHACAGTVLAAYHLGTGEHRELLRMNSPLHHVLPLDRERILFCHPTGEDGMLLTDLSGGWYTHLRAQDGAGTVCHFLPTRRGVAYEVSRGTRAAMAGLYDVDHKCCREFPLPAAFGYTHTGADPEGRLWFYECAGATHDLRVLRRLDPDGRQEWERLCGDWPTYGGGQKSHFHPRLTPDRRWLILTAGDPDTRSNQIFLLDVSDLGDTEGIAAPA